MGQGGNFALVGKPEEGWVWAAPTRSGHMESSSLKRQHKLIFKILAEQAQENNQKPVRKFVLYSLRHTFLTRLGESGCDVWTLARIAGHSEAEAPKAANSIKAKEKYGGRDRDRTGDPLLAKQVLSQLSYTPTVGTTHILKHFRRFQNPFPRFSTITVPKLYQKPRLKGLPAPRQGSFRWRGSQWPEFFGDHEAIRDLAWKQRVPELRGEVWRGLLAHEFHNIGRGHRLGIGKTI